MHTIMKMTWMASYLYTIYLVINLFLYFCSIYSFMYCMYYFNSYVHSSILSFIHPFIHPSFVHSFMHSFIYLFIYSFIHLFIYLFIYLFIHSLVYSKCCLSKLKSYLNPVVFSHEKLEYWKHLQFISNWIWLWNKTCRLESYGWWKRTIHKNI